MLNAATDLSEDAFVTKCLLQEKIIERPPGTLYTCRSRLLFALSEVPRLLSSATTSQTACEWVQLDRFVC